MRFVLFLFILLLIYSCERRKQVDSVKQLLSDTIANANTEIDARIAKEEQLSKLLINQVNVDSLIEAIAPQSKVKLIAKLLPQQNDYGQTVKDDSNHYIFNLCLLRNKNGESNTIITYKEHKIDFSRYKVSCYKGKNCGFGYNFDNTINTAEIIEVCGLKFLYADISHQCNGKGCGIEIKLIYDLQTYQPTFISTYRVPFNGYYISDFNNDGNPDILLAECESDGTNMAFGVHDFTYALTAFTYKQGKFVPPLYNYNKPVFINLYGIGDYVREYASVTEQHWFR